MLRRLFKNEYGSMVVEASMAIPIFMFAIMTILSIINVCTAQVVMTNTVNGLTKDMAKFSYLYCKVGLYDVVANQDSQAADANKAAVTVMKSTDVESLLDNLGDAIDIVEESDNFGESLFHAVLSNGAHALESLVLQGVADSTAKRRLTSTYYDADALLKHYGIENGLSDVDFYIWFDTSTDYLYVMADYDVKVLDLLGIDKTLHFTKKSKAQIWNPKTDYADLSKKEPGSTEETTEDTTESNEPGSSEEETTEEETTEATTEATTEDPKQQRYNALIEQYDKEDIDQILDLYGDEALELIYLYGDGAFLAIYYYGGDAVRLIKEYGQGAVNVICENEKHVVEVLKLIDQYGQDAVDAISEYGYESDEQIIEIINNQ